MMKTLRDFSDFSKTDLTCVACDVWTCIVYFGLGLSVLKFFMENLFIFFQKFVENFQSYFSGTFLPLQTFGITVHLLTTTLFKGFLQHLHSLCHIH